jgi:hypothetical protein
MEPYEPKKQEKNMSKKKWGKQWAIKNQIEKGENAIKR